MEKSLKSLVSVQSVKLDDRLEVVEKKQTDEKGFV